jgi:hypothetical protein
MIISGKVTKVISLRKLKMTRKVFKLNKRLDLNFRLKIGTKPNFPKVMRNKLNHKLMKELGYFE